MCQIIDRELARRQRHLNRADNYLVTAKSKLTEAVQEMAFANNEHYPQNACADRLREALAIVNDVLDNFPTASH